MSKVVESSKVPLIFVILPKEPMPPRFGLARWEERKVKSVRPAWGGGYESLLFAPSSLCSNLKSEVLRIKLDRLFLRFLDISKLEVTSLTIAR